MKSKVIKLADLSECPVSEELHDASIAAETVDEIITGKANELGDVKNIDEVIEGSVAVCKNEEGKKVLVYPGLGIAIAIKAEGDVLGKKVGDVVSTEINGNIVTLTITDILVNVPSEINDELAKKAGIEGVNTLEELKAHILSEQVDKKKTENLRQLILIYNDYLVANSLLEIDEAEEKEFTLKIARSQYDENMSMGIDLRFTEEGDMLSEEEVLESLANDMKMQFKAVLVNRAFCDANGFAPDLDEIRKGAVAEAEMSGITDENKVDEIFEILTENAYYGFVFSKLEEKAKEVLA